MAHRAPKINDTVKFTDQQQAILNDAAEQLMKAGGLTACLAACLAASDPKKFFRSILTYSGAVSARDIGLTLKEGIRFLETASVRVR